MQHLRHLAKNIGPRLTGSPQYTLAENWTASQFRSWGLTNVHLEHWGDVPVGFSRGQKQVARMVEPYERVFEFTTYAWTAGTNGQVRGEAILEPITVAQFNAVKDRLPGAWIVSRSSEGSIPPRTERGVREALSSVKVAGWVYGARDDRVRTQGQFKDVQWEKLPTQVWIIIRKSDRDAISQAFRAERKVVLEFDIDNRFTKGPIPQHNVIAEIPGSLKPDEVVIFSAHLDSWDGPGSEGANDNGTGCAAILEAARILSRARAKPLRTIRFILWGAEEQGLFGSRAYAMKHLSELSKISGVFVDDGGSNYQGGVTATKDMVAVLSEAMAPMKSAFPSMPVNINVVERFPVEEQTSDQSSFTVHGVPGFYFHETGRQDYAHVWHTQYDTFETTIPEYLVQSATNSAVMSYNLACANALLPRIPKADSPLSTSTVK